MLHEQHGNLIQRFILHEGQGQTPEHFVISWDEAVSQGYVQMDLMQLFTVNVNWTTYIPCSDV